MTPQEYQQLVMMDERARGLLGNQGMQPNTAPAPARKTLGERATGLLSQIGRAIYGEDDITRLRRQNAFQAMTLNPNQALITSNAAQIQKLQEQELLRQQGEAAANVLMGGTDGTDPMKQQISAMVSQGLITPNQGMALLNKNPTNIEQILSLGPEALQRLSDMGYFASMPGQAWQAAQYNTYVDRQQELRTSARDSRNLINDISNVALILNRIPETGPQEQTKQVFRDLFKKFGMPVDDTAFSNAQSLQAAVTRLVAQELRKNKGPQTDFDAIFLARTLPGLGTSEQANADILKYMMAQNELITSISDVANVRGGFDVVSVAVDTADDLAAKAPTFILGENAQPVYFTEFKNSFEKENPGKSAGDMLRDWIALANESRSIYAELIGSMGGGDVPTAGIDPQNPLGLEL